MRPGTDFAAENDRRVGEDDMRLGRGDWRRPRSLDSICGALALAAIVACAPAPSVGERKPAQEGPAGPAQSFATLAADVIVPRCATASCHAGEYPPAYPPLDAHLAYGALVEAPSLQMTMNLGEPFAPENSSRVLKLRGTAGEVGGVASPMPIGDAVLDESEIQAIEAWIANGAPND
jgi:hypothetical protein